MTDNPSDLVTFSWTPSVDPEGEELRYSWRLKNAETNETLLSKCWVDGTQVEISISELQNALSASGGNSEAISLTQEVTTSDLFTIVTSEPLLTTYQNSIGTSITKNGIAESYQLEQNCPNPFNTNTVISYYLPQSGMVSLKVYDLFGKEVAALVQEYKSAGKYEIEFNASSFPGGIYYYELITNEFRQAKKMILMK